LTGTLNGAELLASPSDRSSRLGALLSVDGNGGADEFAVAAKVAGASIVDAALVVRIGIDETVAGGEQGTAHHAAFLFRVQLHLVGGALDRFVWLRGFASAVDGPQLRELVRRGNRASAVSRGKIVAVVAVEITA